MTDAQYIAGEQLARKEIDRQLVACGWIVQTVGEYSQENRHQREETEQFRRFTYDEIMARDKASLDIFWLRDESLEDTANLPPPGVIAAEIVEDLEAALAEFAEIATELGEEGRETTDYA
jgi:hypothetical protein